MPEPDPCPNGCPHPFDTHVLERHNDNYHGTWFCPIYHCDCRGGTWSLGDPT